MITWEGDSVMDPLRDVVISWEDTAAAMLLAVGDIRYEMDEASASTRNVAQSSLAPVLDTPLAPPPDTPTGKPHDTPNLLDVLEPLELAPLRGVVVPSGETASTRRLEEVPT